MSDLPSQWRAGADIWRFDMRQGQAVDNEKKTLGPMFLLFTVRLCVCVCVCVFVQRELKKLYTDLDKISRSIGFRLA